MKASFPRSLSFYQLLLISFTRQFLPDIIRVLYYRGRSEARKTPAEPYHSSGIALQLTFGGMWRWRRVAVARVFALVVRCRVMQLLLYSRVGKNRDTRRGSPAGAGAGRTADHLAVLFSQKVLEVRSANDIYRPVSTRPIIPFFG